MSDSCKIPTVEGDHAEAVLASKAFIDWHKWMRDAGHVVQSINVKHVTFVGSGFPFLIVFQPCIWVAEENRSKYNEVVCLRPDIVHVCVFSRGRTPDQDRFVFIQEFRSTVKNFYGFVFELPGGSGVKKDLFEQMRAELIEETGLDIPLHRFRSIGGGSQVAPTFAVHQAHLGAVELTNAEMDHVEATTRGTVHGNESETERTYVHVLKRDSIFGGRHSSNIGWDTKGMIATVTEEYK